MSGGGMGFMFQPGAQGGGAGAAGELMHATKRELEHAVPFAMEPVVYDFAINERGTDAELLQGDGALMPPGYYTLTVPPLCAPTTHLISPARRAELDALQRRPAGRAELCGNGPAPVRSPAAAGPGTGDGHRAEPGGTARDSRLRPRAARADPGRPAQRAHRPGAEPAAGQHAASRMSRPDDVSTRRGELAAVPADRAWTRWRPARWRW